LRIYDESTMGRGRKYDDRSQPDLVENRHSEIAVMCRNVILSFSSTSRNATVRAVSMQLRRCGIIRPELVSNFPSQALLPMSSILLPFREPRETPEPSSSLVAEVAARATRPMVQNRVIQYNTHPAPLLNANQRRHKLAMSPTSAMLLPFRLRSQIEGS